MPLCTALGKEKMDDGARDSDQEEGHQHREFLANLLLRLLNPLPLRAVCRERKDRQLLHRPEMAAHQRANLAEICDCRAPCQNAVDLLEVRHQVVDARAQVRIRLQRSSQRAGPVERDTAPENVKSLQDPGPGLWRRVLRRVGQGGEKEVQLDFSLRRSPDHILRDGIVQPLLDDAIAIESQNRHDGDGRYQQGHQDVEGAKPLLLAENGVCHGRLDH